MQKSPKLEEYNKKGDPDDYVQLVNDQFNYDRDASKSNLSVLVLVGSVRLWFNEICDNCIDS